ncbi:MAG TPA: FkbM family methyltransferase, partial [Epsilonproteobacteria bacterium]|nr:FkbM family methyltransferase [Campylobacterota bacterium]
MGIVSYAQNFEDVMLWRALKDVKNGFYIDIGANHPSIDSVTKLFYENGWNGINCEPEKELYKLLEEERPNDINLNIAISSNLQQIEFYVSKVRGWSTTDVLSADNLKEKDSFAECKIVKAMSLDNLCKSYNIKEVHFLKIDVEGAEKDVLESFSFDKIRPWICVIEATKPTTQIDVSIEWEDILIVNKYIFAYFDGLNKYYVAEEHKNFVDILKNPPNVFDEFILANHRDAIIKASEAETKAIQAEEKAAQAETKAIQAEEKAAQAETKTVQAEEKAAQAETKTIQAEEKAAQAETKAIQAEEKSAQAETKAIQAEEKAAQAETKAIQAEEKAAQAETKAIQAEEKA